MSGFAPDVSLLALLARSTSARPDAPALCESGGRTMSYAEVSNASANLARDLASLGLPPRSSVALVLPNGCELAIAVLAVLQSGHVAVPMPVGWRKSDLVRACREAEAAALITTANFAMERLPELAAQVAIEVFELSFPCSFGTGLPDGIMPLKLSTAAPLDQPIVAASQGIATLKASPNGVSLVVHSDGELLAAGLGALLSADMQSGDRIVSAVSLSNFAGLAGAFVPWLLAGGVLHPVSDITVSGNRDDDTRTHLVAPVGAARAIAQSMHCSLVSVGAVHFGGTMLSSDFSDVEAERIVDLIALSELAVVVSRRTQTAMPAPIPQGAIFAGSANAGAPVILETSIGENGNILVRGAQTPRSVMQSQTWLDTGFPASARQGSFHVNSHADDVAIGSLRFNLPELERRILAAAPVAGIEVIDDPILGNCVVVVAPRVEETTQALLDAGLPRVIATSVQKADTARTRLAQG